MLRFHKTGLRPGDTVYIIDGEWFRQWRKVTGYEVHTYIPTHVCILTTERAVLGVADLFALMTEGYIE